MEPIKPEPYTVQEMRAWLELLQPRLGDLDTKLVDDEPLPARLAVWPHPGCALVLKVHLATGMAIVGSLWAYSASGDGTSTPDVTFAQEYMLIVGDLGKQLSRADPEAAAARLRELLTQGRSRPQRPGHGTTRR